MSKTLPITYDDLYTLLSLALIGKEHTNNETVEETLKRAWEALQL